MRIYFASAVLLAAACAEQIIVSDSEFLKEEVNLSEDDPEDPDTPVSDTSLAQKILMKKDVDGRFLGPLYMKNNSGDTVTVNTGGVEYRLDLVNSTIGYADSSNVPSDWSATGETDFKVGELCLSSDKNICTSVDVFVDSDEADAGESYFGLAPRSTEAKNKSWIYQWGQDQQTQDAVFGIGYDSVDSIGKQLNLYVGDLSTLLIKDNAAPMYHTLKKDDENWEFYLSEFNFNDKNYITSGTTLDMLLSFKIDSSDQ